MNTRRLALGAALLGLCLPAGVLAQSETKVVSGQRKAGDQFGIMCVTDGNVVVVGARLDDRAGTNAGAAYVFERSGSGWAESAVLTASDASPLDEFGGMLALEGNRLFVGSLRDDNGGIADTGSVYVYERDASGAWNEVAKLLASDPGAAHFFGNYIDVDGGRALIGAVGHSGLRGAAYVFELDAAGVWNEVARLGASDGAADDRFGDAVALSAGTAMIGAPGDDGTGSWSGSAYVFELQGGSWNEVRKLVPSGLGPTDNFASALSMTADTLVAGAREHSGRGAAYVFERGNGDWSSVTKLVASNAFSQDFFGHDVRIDQDRILVGAVGKNSSTGAAYVFDRGVSGWVESNILAASDGAPGDFFGHSVAVSGQVMVAGARGDDGGMGAAYVYEEQSSLDPSLSSVEVDPTEIQLGEQATVTVTPRNGQGALMGAGLNVEIDTTLGTLLGSVVDQGDGTYTQQILGDVAGTADITSVVEGVPLLASASLSITDPMSNLGSVAGVQPGGTLVPYASIQAAVSSAERDGLERILVPPGVYDEYVAVCSVQDLSIEGLVSYGAVVVRGFRVENSQDVVIDSFEVSGSPHKRHGIELRGGKKANRNVMLVNLLVDGTAGKRSGIVVRHGNHDVTIDGCIVQGCGGDGVHMRGASDGHVVQNSSINGNGRNGIYLHRKVKVTIANNVITDNGLRGKEKAGYGILRQRGPQKHAHPEWVTLITNLVTGNRGKVVPGKSDLNFGNYDQMFDPSDNQSR